MSQPGAVVDRISEALARRRAQVAAEERRAEQVAELRRAFESLIEKPVTLDVPYLVEILRATWERVPVELEAAGWTSPSTDDWNEAVNEILAIGAKVADVLEVYNKQLATVAGSEAGP